MLGTRFIAGEYPTMPFLTFLLDVFIIFVFVLWFWLLITVIGDLFRRHDVGGFGKVIWVLFLLFLPFLGVFMYLLTQGSGMAKRGAEQVAHARDELRHIVGFSAADEIAKLDKLKADGKLTDAEYASLRAKALA